MKMYVVVQVDRQLDLIKDIVGVFSSENEAQEALKVAKDYYNDKYSEYSYDIWEMNMGDIYYWI